MDKIEMSIQKQIESIDISKTAYRQAEKKYHSVGEWLRRKKSVIANLSPDVYAQGSFALGTVIKPLDNEEDYDIDLVCQLKAEKSEYTQKKIKSMLGNELKEYAKKNGMENEPEEARRCWTMIYVSSCKSSKFHLDALPSISKLSYKKAVKKYKNDKDTDIFQISITDNEKENYNIISGDWNMSNPKGYAEWFKSKQRKYIEEKMGKESQNALFHVENILEYPIKTPLQKAIQFLKRHRDIYFQDNIDLKPISIIITTLVTQTHDECNYKISDIIIRFIKNYNDFIKNDTFIYNPVDIKENFADKWSNYPERKYAFFKWVEYLKSNFQQLGELIDYKKSDKYIISLLQKSPDNIKYNRIKKESNNIDFDVSHKEQLEFPLIPKVEIVQITATCCKKNGGYRTKVLRPYQSIEKNHAITFKVNDKHIRGKKKYYWQVVNTGCEAENENDLRGTFYEGEVKRGYRTRKENTKYIGTHWVQCFIVQNKECIARSSEFVIEVV